MSNENKDLVLYILMRNDLPSMNPGKAMAQAAHASNQFVNEVADFDKEYGFLEGWMKQGNGYGTTIVLSVNKEELNNVMNMKIVDAPLFKGTVIDETYPYIVNKEIADLIPVQNNDVERIPIGEDILVCRKETTCGYVFGDKNNKYVNYLTKWFPLHK